MKNCHKILLIYNSIYYSISILYIKHFIVIYLQNLSIIKRMAVQLITGSYFSIGRLKKATCKCKHVICLKEEGEEGVYLIYLGSRMCYVSLLLFYSALNLFYEIEIKQKHSEQFTDKIALMKFNTFLMIFIFAQMGTW